MAGLGQVQHAGTLHEQFCHQLVVLAVTERGIVNCPKPIEARPSDQRLEIANAVASLHRLVESYPRFQIDTAVCLERRRLHKQPRGRQTAGRVDFLHVLDNDIGGVSFCAGDQPRQPVRLDRVVGVQDRDESEGS